VNFLRVISQHWSLFFLLVLDSKVIKSFKMASNLIKRFREGIPGPHLRAKGTENVKGEDMWLDNDDIRPLKLADRSTYPLFMLHLEN
jgi:hypothetical protein